MCVGLYDTQKSRHDSAGIAKTQKIGFYNGDRRHLRDGPTITTLGTKMPNHR